MADLGVEVGAPPRRRSFRGRRLGPQHVGQRQAGAERADLEEVAAIQAVAERLRIAENVQHLSPLLEIER